MACLPRILIAAAHKSSGKTTFSVGLGRALARQGSVVQMFKKGPDYIDPLWHRLAVGRASYNLDFNTQSHEEILALFGEKAAGADLSIIETNKGLHDGMALDGADSNAALAKLLKAPVVLVIDTMGITRGIAPLLLGYQAFDADVHIAGVVLNRVAGPRHEAKLRAAVERYADMPVLGALPRDARLALKERHLGLTTPEEAARRDEWIAAIGEMVAAHVDMVAIAELARRAPALEVPPRDEVARVGEGLRIGVARDAAFCFTYADDLETFTRAGAELVFFSPLRDERPPRDIHGLFLPGGFPETHMRQLQANAAMRARIAAAIRDGLPAYAECGGLMYLAECIRWQGEEARMCGVVPGEAVMHDRPQGRGIVHLRRAEQAPWSPAPCVGDVVRAHEFHHATLEGADWNAWRFAWVVARGAGITGEHDGIVVRNLVAGFAHLRHARQSPWITAFLRFVRQRKKVKDEAGARGEDDA